MVDIFVSKKKFVGDKRQMSQVSQVGKVRKGRQVSGQRKRYGMGPRYRRVAERLSKQRQGGNLRSFSILPGRVRFETQETREKIILLLRQHWVTQFSWVLTAGVMMWLPLCLLWIPILDFLPGNFQFMAVVIWYLLIIAFIYEKFILWFYHVFIITDERVIDVDFYNLLYKEVSEAKIDNIEDVTYRQGGMVKAWLNFGDISLQTAGEKQEFMIENVPQPFRVVKILNELKLEEEHEKIEGRVR